MNRPLSPRPAVRAAPSGTHLPGSTQLSVAIKICSEQGFDIVLAGGDQGAFFVSHVMRRHVGEFPTGKHTGIILLVLLPDANRVDGQERRRPRGSTFANIVNAKFDDGRSPIDGDAFGAS